MQLHHLRKNASQICINFHKHSVIGIEQREQVCAVSVSRFTVTFKPLLMPLRLYLHRTLHCVVQMESKIKHEGWIKVISEDFIVYGETAYMEKIQ